MSFLFLTLFLNGGAILIIEIAGARVSAKNRDVSLLKSYVESGRIEHMDVKHIEAPDESGELR